MIANAAAIAHAAAYATARIGLPWENGASGPDSYDCGGLLCTTQRELFGRHIDVGNIDADNLAAVIRAAADHPLLKIWNEVRRPQHGDAMLLSSSKRAHHCGTYFALERGRLFHCVEDGGVRCDAMNTLEPLGWTRITFWRPPA